MENNFQNESAVVQEKPATTRKPMSSEVLHFILLTVLSLIIGATIAVVSIVAIGMEVWLGIVVGVMSGTFAFELFFSEKIRELLGAAFEKTVDLPGVIFELDIDGILFYIIYKFIIAPLATLFVGILFAIGGILLCLIISPFFFFFTLGAKISELAEDAKDGILV